VGPQL